MDKRHYYDGKIYENLIDPALKSVREVMTEQVGAGSNVIDLGCGTGALVFDMAKKCKSVVGIELSLKMLNLARKRQKILGIENVNFIQADAANLPQFQDKQFDFATTSMVIHEIPPGMRVDFLKEAKRIATKIIVADYMAFLPYNFTGIMLRIAEFLAGREHFKGFRDFQRNMGLDYLFGKCGLSVISELKAKNGTIRIVEVR